jgi:hypothetical protein
MIWIVQLGAAISATSTLLSGYECDYGHFSDVVQNLRQAAYNMSSELRAWSRGLWLSVSSR